MNYTATKHKIKFFLQNLFPICKKRLFILEAVRNSKITL